MKGIKTIGKDSEKIGNVTVSGEGASIGPVKEGSEDVAVRDYVAAKGYSGIVSWDGKNPTVAGVKVNPTEIRNGIAYVKKSEIDSVLSDMEKGAGIKAADKLREEKYGKMENDALDAVINRKPFEYYIENDSVYQAYEKQYKREAEYALRRILNDNNTSVTGATGAVLSEAVAAYNEELHKISDVIPELYEDAYERYQNEGVALNDNLKEITDIADSYYNSIEDKNNDIKKNIIEAGDTERKEREKISGSAREEEKQAYENALKDIELQYYSDEIESDITSKRTDTEKTAIQNAISRGFFVEEDEKIMPWLAEYRTGNGSYSISPSVAAVAYEYQVSRAKEKGKIDAKLGL